MLFPFGLMACPMSIDSGKSDSWLAVKVRVFWADSMLQAILPKPIHHSKTDHVRIWVEEQRID
jgi:hypothetical protein